MFKIEKGSNKLFITLLWVTGPKANIIGTQIQGKHLCQMYGIILNKIFKHTCRLFQNPIWSTNWISSIWITFSYSHTKVVICSHLDILDWSWLGSQKAFNLLTWNSQNFESSMCKKSIKFWKQTISGYSCLLPSSLNLSSFPHPSVTPSVWLQTLNTLPEIN